MSKDKLIILIPRCATVSKARRIHDPDEKIRIARALEP